jgi:hypothetical protein
MELDLYSLRKLKEATINAHPDKGGSSEAFIKAREEYLRHKLVSEEES